MVSSFPYVSIRIFFKLCNQFLAKWLFEKPRVLRFDERGEVLERKGSISINVPGAEHHVDGVILDVLLREQTGGHELGVADSTLLADVELLETLAQLVLLESKSLSGCR